MDPKPGVPAPPRHVLAALASAAGAFAAYLRTLAPTVTGEDSGELIAAAYTLGIPHPPGYPLWCLLGHLFTRLPFGTVAWRVNLMSAVFAAATVFLVAILIHALTRRRLAAAAGALALAFSAEFWEQAVIAEVYALNAFCLALCLVLLWKWQITKASKWLYGFALAYGLSLGNHNTMAVLGPVFVVYILCVDADKKRRARRHGCALLIAASAAALLYLYLPVRSLANPPVDWGNPETLANFWDVVRHEQFAFMAWENPRSLPRFLAQLAAYARLCGNAFSWPIALLGMAGLLLLLRRHRAFTAQLMAVAAAVILAFTLVQNFNLDKEWLWVMTPFAIPAHMAAAVGLGGLIAWVNRKPSPIKSLAWPLAIFIAGAPLALHWRQNDKSEYFWARDYAKNVLESLPRGAIYIPATDHGAFAPLYLQVVEGVRTDVLIGRKYGYVEAGMLRDAPEASREAWGEFPKRRHEPQIFSWLLAHSTRPVFFAKPLPLEGGVRFKQHGLLYQALRPGEEGPAEKSIWDAYHWNTLDHADARGDYTAELILYEYALARAAQALANGERNAGAAWLEQGLDAYGREAKVLNNAGVLCARLGLEAEAAAYFRQALDHTPQFPAAKENLARLEEKTKK